MALTADTAPAQAPPFGAAYLIEPDAVDSVRSLLMAAGLCVTPRQGSEAQVPRYTVSANGNARLIRDQTLAKLLTEREMEVLLGMSDGKSNREIGDSLFLSEQTVKTHAKRVFRKLGVTDRAHAVAIGFRRGILGGA